MRDDTLRRLAADTIALLERDGIQAIDRFARTNTRPLRHNGLRYRGGNALALWATAELKGYTSPYWLTFKQAQELGGHVRKGEQSTVILYVDRIRQEDDPEDKGRVFVRAYPVFNACQIEGLPAHYFPASVPPVPAWEAQDAVEAFIHHTGARIVEGSSDALYRPRTDEIHMPHRARFAGGEAYYATLLHELIHWTGAETRLNRRKSARFGDEAYAMEELVAEIGAAMLCGELGLSKTPREDHAHYLASWLRALRKDPRALWSAGAEADKAADYLHGLQPQAMPLAA